MNLEDIRRVFGRLFCLLGFHDLQVIDKNFGFGGGGSVEKVRCCRCQLTFTR